MFLAIGGVTQTGHRTGAESVFGKRRVRNMIDKTFAITIIVCGFGRIGRGAALELQRAEVRSIVIRPE